MGVRRPHGRQHDQSGRAPSDVRGSNRGRRRPRGVVSRRPTDSRRTIWRAADARPSGAMIRDSRSAVSFVFGLVGGILILLVSVIYLPYLFSPYYGGPFFVGMALSITGGAIAVVVGAGPGIVREPIRQRACTSCGMFLSIEYAHCPYCGHAVAQVPH